MYKLYISYRKNKFSWFSDNNEIKTKFFICKDLSHLAFTINKYYSFYDYMSIDFIEEII